MSEDHIEWIEALQPYNGVDWTRNLASMSNQDKHRLHVNIVPSYTIDLDVDEIVESVDPSPGRIHFRVHERILDLHIELDPNGPLDEVKQEGLRAIPTLQSILLGVEDIASRFLVAFDLPPLVVTLIDEL